MLDRSLHPHQANAHRLQRLFYLQRSSSSPSPGCGQSSKAGAEPGTAPAGLPRPGLRSTPGAFGPGNASLPPLSGGFGPRSVEWGQIPAFSVSTGSVRALRPPSLPSDPPPAAGAAPPPYPQIPVAAGCHSHPGGCSGCW